MGTEAPACRLCGSRAAHDLGPIPDSDYFAGQVLPRPLEGGRLWGCEACGSMFRHPILSPEQYLSLYSTGDAQQWDSGPSREDLRTIGSIIASAPIRSTLDVGCGSGEFLASLPEGVARYGIEPSMGAASLASARGVTVLASELEHCPPEKLFDAVTVIDVVEHVPYPDEFLQRAYSCVSPGGLLIVSTGDPDTFFWRRCLKARFWYVSFPEHISFPAAGFFARWCESNGAELIARHQVRYRRSRALHRLAGWAIQMTFAVSPAAFSFVGRSFPAVHASGARGRQLFSPGVPGTFRDHQIVVLRKPSAVERENRKSH